MGFHSEEEAAIALAAAVQSYVDDRARSGPVPRAIEEGLDTLLYGWGGDGILELSVSHIDTACVTILGIVIWVEEQTLGPLEAKFQLDKPAGAVKALTIRAGDKRIPRRDAPKYPQSWRNLHRIIAARPTADEDWAHALQHKFD